MRNITFFVIFSILIALAIAAMGFQLCYGNKDNLGIFLVTALTAIGTCGVTILSIFPYEHKDKLESVVYFWKNSIRLKITNKTNHITYLGTDKYATSKYYDAYARWWSTEKCNPDDGNDLLANPGDNLAIPPKSSIYYLISPKIFGRNKLSKLKIQVLTSSGYRFDVKNNLT